jgi:hypothetical protein
MSAKQIVILTATVVGLIVVVTLAKVYLGGLGSKETAQKAVTVLKEPHLKFAHMGEQGGSWVVVNAPNRFSDPMNPGPPEEEMGADGHYDFWFKNDNDRDVTLAVTKLSCNRCLHLEVALAPEDWQARQAARVAGAAGLGPAGMVGGGAAEVAADTPGPDANTAWETLESRELNREAKGFTVPPHRAGWARFAWKDEEAGGKILAIDLATESGTDSAPAIRLQFGALFVEPVRVLPESKKQAIVDKIGVGDRPHEVSYIVYSSTRSAFKLDAEPLEEQQRRHPFAVCGKPVPLTRRQCDDLQKQHRMAVLCGYTVPVTVYEHLEDGRHHDLGPFYWTVAVKSDAMDNPIALSVGGAVEIPEIKVLSGGDERDLQDRIAFGTFPRSRDITRKVVVEVPVGTPLKIDKVPDYLQAELEAEEPPKGARRQAWGLTVTVRANTVTGHFPNPDDPLMRDTAIYLQAKDRRVRIPVSGTAGQR